MEFSIELKAIAEKIQPEFEIEQLQGKKETIAQYHAISDTTKGYLPPWLIYLLTQYEIPGLIIRFLDLEQNEKAIHFFSFAEIDDNILVLEPGKSIVSQGWLCIADDPRGTESSYFINILHGNNPAVFFFHRDIEINNKSMVHECKVSNSVSDLLNNQIFTTD